MVSQQRRFALERVEIGFEPMAPACRGSVAATVMANLLAERDVDIERDLACDLFELLDEEVRADRAEFRRRRKAGVTRDGCRKQFGMIRPHADHEWQIGKGFH